MRRKYRLMSNTVLLAAVSFTLRATDIFFHAFLAGKIGASGIGLFSLVMSIYRFGVTFACSGIGLASARMISERLAEGKTDSLRRTENFCLLHGLFFGGVALAVIFVGAPFLGSVLPGEGRTVLPLKILSLSLPCVSMSSALHGYFSAVGRVGKSAFVQLAEQGIRIGGCMFLLSRYAAEQPEYACAFVVAGGCVAELCSFFFLFCCYRMDVARYGKKTNREKTLKQLLHISMPVAVSSYVRSGLSSAEHTLIPHGLKRHSGNAETALAAYGTVHGMALPLILFPSAALQAFSTMLIPEVSMHRQRGETEKISRLTEYALKLTMLFSVGAAGVLFFFSDQIGLFVYHNAEAAYFIRLISPLAVVMYADGVVDAVLKGMNQQVYSMGYNIVDSALALVLLVILLPSRGINGYIMVIYITEMVNAFLSVNRLIHILDFKLHPVRNAVVPVLCICACSLFAGCVFTKIPSPIVAVVLYLLLMLLYYGKTASCKTGTHMLQ